MKAHASRSGVKCCLSSNSTTKFGVGKKLVARRKGSGLDEIRKAALALQGRRRFRSIAEAIRSR